MQDQGEVQDGCLQVGVGLVGPEHAEDVLRRGEPGVRPVDVHALVVDVVVVGVVAVHRQHREHADEEDALADHVVEAVVQSLLVVGRQGEDASGDGVHDVLPGGDHDDVPDEHHRELPLLRQVELELLQLTLVRELSEKQEVGALLEAEALVEESLGEVADVVAAVLEPALAWHLDAVDLDRAVDLGDGGESDDDPVSLGVAQSFFHVVFLVEVGGEAVGRHADLGLLLDVSLVVAVHSLLSPYVVCGPRVREVATGGR